ncbi:uncharacterized protein EDB91DRAFT_1257684 [Suillus paluster]|uniref:uncharacterized protein n=1 Tax=Suillus paluster TaxID=48578 RepID=UPI001B88495F|nr:uncharacterized protein EDB91DRAFT_1257684 [Suillus paluster]KAG1719422.1 hypothetical protein EDB91DRAFT_1257684 [Suillus paluster]
MLDSADCDLPWFKDLNPIWCTNPAFAAKTHSSKPGVDHAGELYALMHSTGGTGPSTKSRNPANAQHSSSIHVLPPSTHAATMSAASTSAYAPLPSTHTTTSTTSISTHVPLPSIQAATTSAASTSAQSSLPDGPFLPDPAHSSGPQPSSHRIPPYGPFLPEASHLWLASLGYSNKAQIDPHLLNFQPPSPGDPDTNRHAMPLPDDDFNIYNDNSMYDSFANEEDYSVISLDSPPKVVGKKCHLGATPSPPPNAPFPVFEVTQKSRTPIYDSCAAFRSCEPTSHGHPRKPASIASSGMTCSISTPTTITCDGLSDLISPTPKTSLSANLKGTSMKYKRVKSSIQEQVNKVSMELESMQSDTASCRDSRNEHLKVKLNAKLKYHHEEKKYQWLCESCSHDAMQATATHQREQEARDAEICLCEGDERVQSTVVLLSDSEESSLERSEKLRREGDRGDIGVLE